MKTLKKNNEFKRVKDSTPEERKSIDSMIANGWDYAPKSEWRKSNGKATDKVETNSKEVDDKKPNKKSGKNK